MKTAQLKTRKPAPVANGAVERGGTRIFANDVQLHVPGWVVDLESFRRWTDTEEFPERGNIWWLCGEVWADMSKEQIFSHLAAKMEFFRVLGNLAKGDCPGMVIPDGLLLSNYAADISGNPDATFLSEVTAKSDRVRLIEGKKGGYVEIQGTPDMVLEVVSDSSEEKDTVKLMAGYWKAQVPEYWLVDARGEQTRFDIWKLGPNGYRRAASRHGWIASGVFGKSFRLVVQSDRTGRKTFTLDVR
jgi:Uma2 family endonuclease